MPFASNEFNHVKRSSYLRSIPKDEQYHQANRIGLAIDIGTPLVELMTLTFRKVCHLLGNMLHFLLVEQQL